MQTMKTKLLLLTLLIVSTCSAQLKIDKQHFVDLLSQGRYGDCYHEAMELRKKEYGKCCIVDYFIARALCADGHNKNAVVKYGAILKNYKLSDANRRLITNEMTSCSTDNQATPTVSTGINMKDFNMILAMKLPEAAVRGKMGNIYNCKMPPQAVANMRDVSTAELESRLFTADESAKAIKKYKSILNANYHVRTSGRFIFITHGNTILNNDQLAKTTEKLEKTYNFFITEYSLRPPDKLLAVYLLPDKNIFRQTALLVHGIKVPDANIGYSNISDLSLVGISDATHIGTLCHELFHLMVRTDVGDVPPWMDEGIACIYETSRWNGDKLLGDVQNWRTDVLRKAKQEMRNKIPHLREFINYTWEKFDGFEDNDICVAAIDYAYGKHLMLYLQEQGKLPTLLTAVKNRKEITDVDGMVTQTDIELFEQALNDNVDNVETKFNEWMLKNYNFKPNGSNAVKYEETFLENWIKLSERCELLGETTNNTQLKDTLQSVKRMMMELKNSYDNLKSKPVVKEEPVANGQQILNEEMTQNVVQPKFRDTSVHGEILEKEKTLQNLEPLKIELRIYEALVNTLENTYAPKMAK